MTKQELEKKLKKSGWTIIHGRAHDMAINPDYPGVKVPIPRHAGDIPTGTLESIKKATGIK